MRIRALTLLTTLFYASICATDPTITTKPLNAQRQEVTISVDVPEGDAVYHEYLKVDIDQPKVTLSKLTIDPPPVAQYDPTFEETKEIVTQPFTITFTANATGKVTDANVNLSLYRRTTKRVETVSLPITFATQLAERSEAQNSESDETPSPQPKTQAQKTTQKGILDRLHEWGSRIEKYLVDLFNATDSPWMHILFAFLFGLLLSLTPCIYPMIPITVGILQAQGSKSIARNFLLSLSYAVGMSAMFAVLGAAAGMVSMLSGLVPSWIFILLVVAVLAYFAFSLLGFYEMWLPQFMQVSTGSRGGSFLSAFIAGVASGTVASPCLSPGLFAVLSVVSTTGSSAVMGFALLFAFGIGLSAPLILVGTFSASVDMLPKAGVWMIEIKRLFGLVMLYMCFFFLEKIMPWCHLLWLAAATLGFVGIYYLFQGSKKGCSWRVFKNCLGILLVISSVLLFAYAYRETYLRQQEESVRWLTEYQEALTVARAQKKKILIDVTSPYCSMCKAVEKKIFCDKQVVAEIDLVVPLKIDESDHTDTIEDLKKRHNILRAPTFIIIDPEDDELEMCRWTSDLYDLDPEEFVNILRIQACRPGTDKS